MYRTVMLDARRTLYANLVKLTQTPRGALAFAEAAADRLEGKPVQKHEVRPVRQAFFGPAPDPGEPRPGPPPAPGQLSAPPTNGAPHQGLTMTGPNGARLRPI